MIRKKSSLVGRGLLTTTTAAAVILLIGFYSNHENPSVMVEAAKSVKLLDDGAKLNMDSLANTVCRSVDGREGQLSRVSTIQKLADHFESHVKPGHKLSECKEQHAEALRTLNDVLTVSQANVCSDEKLALIEDYHNQFVSTQLAHVEARQKQNQETAPYLLNLFFMHYTMEVDALCKRTLINNLEWDLKDKFGDDFNEKLFMIDNEFSDAERQSFGKIFKGVMGKFTDLYALNKYEDAILVWDLLEGSVLNQDNDQDIRDEYDQVTGEPIRLKVKIKSSKYLNRIKEHCYYNMKPIYGKLILPIIKLSDLGYTNSGEQFKIELDELKTNDNVKRWYGTTQMCEALLPVVFYEDPELSPESVVVVVSKEEAAELKASVGNSSPNNNDNDGEPQSPTRVKLEYEPQTNTMVGLDKLESIETSEAQSMVKRVKANVGTRDRAMNRAISHLFRNLKHQLAESRVGKFFFSKKTTTTSTLVNPKGSEKEVHYEQQEVGSKFVQTLDQISDQDLLKINGATGSRMTKSSERAKGIGKRRRHRRKGDVDMIMDMRAEAISYKRTKTWSEIFGGWGAALSTLAPSRMQLIIAGGLIIGLLIVIVLAAVMSTFIAGMG